MLTMLTAVVDLGSSPEVPFWSKLRFSPTLVLSTCGRTTSFDSRFEGTACCTAPTRTRRPETYNLIAFQRLLASLSIDVFTIALLWHERHGA